MAHAHALLKLVPDVAFGGIEPGNGISFGLRNVGDGLSDGDVDAGRFAPGVEHHLADVAESDARIGELALEHGADLLLERLRYAILMVFSPAMFGMRPSQCAPRGPEP